MCWFLILGVFSALLTYVLRFCVTEHEEQEIFIHFACETLRRIARGNSQVSRILLLLEDYTCSQIQMKIFDNFSDFFDVKIGVASVACLLTEVRVHFNCKVKNLILKVLTGNLSLCRSLLEADIKSIYTLAAAGCEPEYYEFYTTLETIMKVIFNCVYESNAVMIAK